MIKYLSAALLAISIAHAAPVVTYNTKVLEDTYTLYALDAQMRQKYHQYSVFFAERYQQTAKKEYLYLSLRMLAQYNELKTLSKLTIESLKVLPEYEVLERFEVIVLLKGGKFAEASQR